MWLLLTLIVYIAFSRVVHSFSVFSSSFPLPSCPMFLFVFSTHFRSLVGGFP